MVVSGELFARQTMSRWRRDGSGRNDIAQGRMWIHGMSRFGEKVKACVWGVMIVSC